MLARQACLVPLAISYASLYALLGPNTANTRCSSKLPGVTRAKLDPQNHQKSQKTSPKDPHGSNRAKNRKNSSVWDPLHMPKLHEGSQKSLFAGMRKNTTNGLQEAAIWEGFKLQNLKNASLAGYQQKTHAKTPHLGVKLSRGKPAQNPAWGVWGPKTASRACRSRSHGALGTILSQY